LPAFVQARWTSDYLPTLYAGIGSAEKPWELPGGDIGFIQEVFDYVYPGSEYRVRSGCPVYVKRSSFGRRAITVVDAFFQTEKYVGKPEKIAKYAKRALRDDGPGLWEVAAPSGVERGDPRYRVPEGIFLSDHVTNVFAPFAKSAAGTMHTWGPLRGGLAMTAAGLERSWMRYTTGFKVDDGSKFSREQVSELVDDYGGSVASLSTRRWRLITDKCRVKNTEEAAVPVSALTMSANRRNLFLPSSPTVVGTADSDSD
ncbi:hypothetical protein B0H10DRAFT_1812773, partial [Mycena sp. CBHHK59/15]